MQYRWADEDVGFNVGGITLKGGNVIRHNIPEPGSKEAYELAFDIQGIDPEDWGFRYNEKTGNYEYNED